MIKLEDLSRDALELLVQVKYARREEKEIDFMGQLIEQSTLLYGKKGKGKTLAAVAVGYNMRKHYNRHVITVGSRMGLKPSFGDFEELSEWEFKESLSKIQDTIDEKLAAEEVVKALKAKGVNLMHAVIFFDEAYKLFDARTPMDKITRTFGYFMSQQRHYHCTTILMAPSARMVDKRVTDQLDWYGQCMHDKRTHKCKVHFKRGLEVVNFTFNGLDGMNHVPYYEMYDSWALVGYRRSSLNIKQEA